tara:strand:- start:182 stop:883 length:702 start_codon:yes stop_codon:yes gene_type:complete
MATSKDKKVLIEKIKNERKFYEFRFEAYGGEAVMGFVTKEAYDYWTEKSSRDFDAYMAEYRDSNIVGKVPRSCQIHKDWYEHDDITHASGVEFTNQNTLYIDRYDKNFVYEDCIMQIPLDIDEFYKLGIKCIDHGSFDCDHSLVENRHYFFGQSFEKGVWYTEEKIKGGPHGLELDKIFLDYQAIDGWPVITGVQYEGYDYYLTADTRGKSLNMSLHEGYQTQDFGKESIKNV